MKESASYIDFPSTDSTVDWGKTSADYATYRADFPEQLFDRLEARGALKRGGQDVLDLGTGTGAIALALSRRGHVVTGLDISHGQIDAARRRAAAQGRDGVMTFTCAPAERTGLDAVSFDVVMAGQCWHWLDRARAAHEVRRLLRPGGRIVIAHFDWLERAGNVVDDTLTVIRQHRKEPSPGELGVAVRSFYPAWLDDLFDAGFTDLEAFAFDVAVGYSHEAWRGRLRASALLSATMPSERVSVVDAALGEMLAKRHREPLAVPHRVFAAIGTAPGSTR